MMGSQNDRQDQFFYNFRLEDHVPEDHLLRRIDAVLDLSGLHEHMAPYYSHTGRPSVDPKLMIRMLIVGYCYGIRSERQLCEEVKLNLAYRWFCRLSLEDEVPHHSTFSKARHGRFRESEALRYVFEQVVERCIAKNLVGGVGFAVDASVVRADASRQTFMDRDDDDDWPRPSGGSRPVKEYLAALDAGAEPAKRISLTDPQARWTAALDAPAFFAYSDNVLADVKAGIILDVAATPAHRTSEVNSTKTMIDRVEARFEIKPEHLDGDTSYGTAAFLGWLVEEKGILPHIPVWDHVGRKPGRFAPTDFTFDAEADCYRCPGGKELKRNRRKFTKPRPSISKDGVMIYRASQHDCRDCPLKSRCCPSDAARKIRRSIHEPARELARSLYKTEGYAQSRRDRKKVEMLFGHMKRILKLTRLRLRGITGAEDEFLMAATTQNLRRMAMWLSTGPPGHSVSAPA
jgi:transposase